MVEQILADLTQFSLKINFKLRSLQQLYNLIICVEDAIKPHVEKILRNVIYKLILDEDKDIAHRTYKIAELLGLYVPTEYILPMMIGHLTDNESRSVPLFVSSSLTAFSAVVTLTTTRFPEQLPQFLHKVFTLIVSSDFL